MPFAEKTITLLRPYEERNINGATMNKNGTGMEE
jgi:hypothetical protein